MAFYTHTKINGRDNFGSVIYRWKTKSDLLSAWDNTRAEPPCDSLSIDEMLGDDMPWACVHGASTTRRILLDEVKSLHKSGAILIV